MTDEQYRRECDRTNREILETLKKVDHNTSVMAVKLFGSSVADEENETGRLPKVERSVKSAHERIDRMNDDLDELTQPEGVVGKMRDKQTMWTGIGVGIVFLIDIALRILGR